MKEKVTKVSKNAKPRTLLVRCDASEYVAKLINYFSDQLADGYWEGQEYHDEFWNCFDFSSIDDNLIITLKAYPLYVDHEADMIRFRGMTDYHIAEYVQKLIIEAIEDYPEILSQCLYDSPFGVDDLKDFISTWKIGLTHDDIVKLLGYDFQYME